MTLLCHFDGRGLTQCTDMRQPTNNNGEMGKLCWPQVVKIAPSISNSTPIEYFANAETVGFCQFYLHEFFLHME